MKKSLLLKVILVILLVPAGIGAIWYIAEPLADRRALAYWSPENASREAMHDIQSGSIKIYLHGSMAAYPIGVDEAQRPLIAGLPKMEAGVGCIIRNREVFEAQGQYAIRYNQAIVRHLQALANKGAYASGRPHV